MSENTQAKQLLWRESEGINTFRASSSWQPLVDEPLRDRIIEAALCVGERMHDPTRVNEIVQLSLKQRTLPTQWGASSLACGFAGIALMQGYVAACFPGQGWDRQAQQSLSIAAEGTQQATLIVPSLFGGTAGMAMTLHALSNSGKRYQKTIINLHQNLCEQVLEQLWLPTNNEREIMADGHYDVISGASGVFAYLLTTQREDEQTLKAIEFLLAYLTWLAEPGQPIGQERWYVPPESLMPETRQACPEGYFNCGLAHGIPWPIGSAGTGMESWLSLSWFTRIDSLSQ